MNVYAFTAGGKKVVCAVEFEMRWIWPELMGLYTHRTHSNNLVCGLAW